MIRRNTGRIDFHLHSYASNITDYYAANSFSIPESYSDPIRLHQELKRQGMSIVTLTDHNSIDGVLEMLDAGLPDVFISAEMTTTFPEDGCNIHVTIANMTEKQFAEANRLRRNIHEMIAYVDAEIAAEPRRPGCNRLAYFMTHPLMSTQNRQYGRDGSLRVEHIEKALLLMNTFEVRNGTRTKSLNELTDRLMSSLDRETIERLANKHGLAPKGEAPWLKAVVGGSDDHSGINPGQTWTELPLPADAPLAANDVIDAIRRRETRPGGAHGGPVTLAHAMLKLLYDGRLPKNRARSRGVTRRTAAGAPAAAPAAPPTRSIGIGGPVQDLLRLVFDGDSISAREKLWIAARSWLQGLAARTFSRRRDGSVPFERILTGEVTGLLRDAAFRASLAAATRTDDRIFLVVSTLVNRIFGRYVARIGAADTDDVVRVIKEAVALVSSNVFVSLPYLLSYFHQSSDRWIVRDVRDAFEIGARPRIVLVTDTLFEVNGVSRTIRKMIDEARRRRVDFTVVTSLGAEEQAKQCATPEIRELIEAGRLKIFPSVVNLDFPKYEGLQIRFPPFLELLKWLQEEGFTKMQISTPGTVGVAGLLAAKLLQIETAATYHTSFPEYVENYTRDVSLEALTWKYMILFYHAVDEVVVPSKFIARLLHERGLRKRRLLVLDRWVDLQRFHPRKRVAGYWKKHGIEDEPSKVKFVYVGRISLEKNLDLLADAFRTLHARRSDAHLILIGDGPHRKGLEERLRGVPATFVGMLEGEELARAIASADAKLFPSTTDTWGNAPLEAQASGLPVVVSDMGGPQELMVDGETGFKVTGRDVNGLVRAMEQLMDRGTRERMGRNARAYVEKNRVDQPFTAILDAEAFRLRARKSKDRDPRTEVRTLVARVDDVEEAHA
jgi:glycosyltransferase involved in cell wall biosynthesis